MSPTDSRQREYPINPRHTILRLRDIMTTDALTVTPETTVREAMELLARHHVSGAPVVSGWHAGRRRERARHRDRRGGSSIHQPAVRVQSGRRVR